MIVLSALFSLLPFYAFLSLHSFTSIEPAASLQTEARPRRKGAGALEDEREGGREDLENKRW